jgi:hypothetical protein
MAVDPLDQIRKGWRSVAEAHSKVQKRKAHRSTEASGTKPRAGNAGLSQPIALRLKKEIAGLDLDDPADQDLAVERFVNVVLAEQLGLEARSGSDFQELVRRVVGALADAGARPDLLRALATLA